MEEVVWSVSDFVGALNQTLEYAYPYVRIVGELANFRVSKNRWVYFDLKDETASLKCFGTVYQLPGPLEDGLLIQVQGSPRLHPLYGFSLNIQSVQPVGEGSLKRAAALLEAKLRAEGLFDDSRKRLLPYPPRSIGLITSGESAAYHDFIKIINGRWRGLDISLADVQVQGEAAPAQLVRALDHFNQQAEPPDILVVTRGGGSAEDLAAFNTELVVRAIAGSRIPTLVAIGHEVDISLAELAADRRASTPSNAAELLVPDRRTELQRLVNRRAELTSLLSHQVDRLKQTISQQGRELNQIITQYFDREKQILQRQSQLLQALSPQAVLKRGYAILKSQGQIIQTVKGLRAGNILTAQLSDGEVESEIKQVKPIRLQ